MMTKTSDIPNQFPASTRQALVQKAQQLSQTKGCYSTVGWSNRLGSVLTPAAEPGVYCADRPFYWNKIDVGCRMAVIELPSSNNSDKPDLWVHSPVGLDGPLQKLLSEIGTIKHIVSPNSEHIKFAPQWAQAYPEAILWAAPGLMTKYPNMPWTKEIAEDTQPWNGNAELWPGIQALHVNCEVNPFTGKPFFNEVIFYHAPSKTLVTTDFYWNYPSSDGITNSNYQSMPGYQDSAPWELAPSVDDIPWGSRLWKQGMDRIYLPFYRTFMVTDESNYQRIVQHILREWDIETVIPAHGDLLRGKPLIQSLLQKHFGVTASD
jgi:hypothetical protein